MHFKDSHLYIKFRTKWEWIFIFNGLCFVYIQFGVNVCTCVCNDLISRINILECVHMYENNILHYDQRLSG